MTGVQEVRVGVRPPGRFQDLVGDDRLQHSLEVAESISRRLSKRVVWNISSTAAGGGVAEMLQSLLGYTRSVGIDTRWLVIHGPPEFFSLTKRIHHALHGSAGDGSALDEAARKIYERTLAENALEIGALVREGDIVLLHDPQTAGLAPYLQQMGARVAWRCHIGLDRSNAEADAGWAFLRPYIEGVPIYVFSRSTYVPKFCDHGKSIIITPSIDAFSAKNQDLTPDAVRTILFHTGLVQGPPPENPDHGFVKDDGSPGRVERRADITRSGRPPAWETPLVVQVSRWDPLKDMLGVMTGFARLSARGCPVQPELVLAGPDVTSVCDDPEGALVFEDVVAHWRQLPQAVRNRVHLASLPVDDIQENAAMVNALQRHAAIVVQKSLEEGFGLTVTEAMWKARPVLASAVGGIQDQIESGVTGVLLEDPEDLDVFADELCGMLSETERSRAMGVAAKEYVRKRFLGLDHLVKYGRVIEALDAA